MHRLQLKKVHCNILMIQAAYDVIRTGGFRIEDIDMTGEAAEDEEMVCGGTMQVMIEPVTPVQC